MRSDSDINTTAARTTVPTETDMSRAITRPARSGSLVAYLATNRVAVSPRPIPAIIPAIPRVDWMRPNSPKETCPKTRATRIIATNTRIRAVAEPNRLQSEPRARRLAIEEEAMRSYRDEGRSFLPSASTISSIVKEYPQNNGDPIEMAWRRFWSGTYDLFPREWGRAPESA